MKYLFRIFIFGIIFTNLLILTSFIVSENQLAYITYNISVVVDRLELKDSYLRSVIGNFTKKSLDVKKQIEDNFTPIKKLLEETRKNIIRIKSVPEKKNENLVEKVLQIAELLEVSLERNGIESVYRMNSSTRHKTIVVNLSDQKIANKLVLAASRTNGNYQFTIQHDLTSFMLPNYQTEDKVNRSCGIISEISNPQIVTKWNQIYGAWFPDSSIISYDGPFWVLSNFEQNNKVKEFANWRSLIRKRPKKIFDLPYEWSGTGHVIINGSLFYNKKNSNILVKYSLEDQRVLVERMLPGALFGNQAPYQWLGSTDIDLSVDERGLWVIYSTHDNAQDIVLSKLDVETLQVIETFETNWRKQWCSNAFMTCGVLYTLKKYDSRKTSLGFTYDTSSKRYKHNNIPFYNQYEWNTMLSYSHKEKRLYAWDNGYLVYYNVTIDSNIQTIS